MAGRGSANLIITDKRSDGYIEKQAWGLDFPMTNLDRTLRYDGLYQHANRDLSEWALTNIHPIPEMGAAILASHSGSSDMALSGWLNWDGSPITAADYWKEVLPPGRRHKWLKYYDGRVDQLGAIVSIARLPRNPSWRFTFLRSDPPGDQSVPQTYPVYFAIALNAWGAIQYQLYIPQLWNEGAGAADPDSYYPMLRKSIDAGSTWEIVDKFSRDDASRWAAAAFGDYEFIYCRFLRDHLVFSLGDLGGHWIYHEEDLEIPEGEVAVEIGGGMMAFHLKTALYMTTGVIERNIGIVPPDDINDVPDAMDWLGDPGDSGGFSVSMETGGGQIWPKATLLSSGAQLYTPVLYEIQATRPSTHAAPVTTVIFDNDAVPADKGKLLDCDFTIAQGWRGSSFRARLRTMQGADEYNLSGNEKASLKVALDAGGFLTQVTGYLEVPKYTAIRGDHPGELIIELTAHDRITRLQNKHVGPLPAFAGWTAGDAITWLLHECAGIPEAQLLIDDDAFDWSYPCPLGWMILQFDQTATVVDVLDELCKASGRTWGMDQNGDIFTRINLEAVYSGTPDFVLDETSTTPSDHLYFVEFERDLFSVRNRVLVLGRDRDGTEVMASFRYDPSVSDPAADPFIGDNWTEVSIGPDGCDPWVQAQIRGSQLLRCRGLLVWETDGHPELFPDHFVEVQVGNIGVPASTVFQITEKYGRLTNAGELTTRFAGVAL